MSYPQDWLTLYSLEATTSSLEALKAYSFGHKAQGAVAALPYFQHAIELDPNFASAYSAAGSNYSNLGELGRASEYFAKAFQLRENANEREKLEITASYYWGVTGELDKSAQMNQEEIGSYPRELLAYLELDTVLEAEGQYEKAAEIARQEVRLAPDSRAAYSNLALDALALQRSGEARQIIQKAQARQLDDYSLHQYLYVLAFLGSESTAMAEQQRWFAGKPEENYELALSSDTEAYGGHLGKARELTKRAVDSAIRADSKETGAIWQAIAAQREGGLWQAFGSAAVNDRGFQAGSDESGRRSRSCACLCHGGRNGTS